MILAPVAPVAPSANETPITVRLIGVLDRMVIESLTDAFAGLSSGARRTLIVLVRDLVVLPDDSLERLLATLAAYRAAGHRVYVESTPAWRKASRGRGAAFDPSSAADGRQARRQIIICHSQDQRSGAA